MRHAKAERSRRIAIVESPVNVRRLTPGFSPFAGMGYDFWVIDLYRQPDELLASLREWRPGAIITEYLPGLTEALVDLGCPVILVPSDQAVEGVLNIDIDDQAIGRLAAEHLVARGYRNFAFVGRERRAPCEAAVGGVPVGGGEVAVYWEEFRDWRQYDEYWRDPDEDMVGWLADQVTPLGIFTAHDPTGRHVLRRRRRRDWRCRSRSGWCLRMTMRRCARWRGRGFRAFGCRGGSWRRRRCRWWSG